MDVGSSSSASEPSSASVRAQAGFVAGIPELSFVQRKREFEARKEKTTLRVKDRGEVSAEARVERAFEVGVSDSKVVDSVRTGGTAVCADSILLKGLPVPR